MAINRYTNLTPATFNPLSVNEIMMVPLLKQKQHDASLEAAIKLDEFDVNRLPTDEDVVMENINKIRGTIRGVEDELYEKGISRGVTRKLIQAKRDRDSFLSNEGVGGKAQQAYNLYQQNVKDIMSNKNMNPEDQQAAIMFARQQYDQSGGVAKEAQYSPYIGFNSVNVAEKLREYGKELEPFIRKTSGWYKDPDDPTMWRKGTTKVTQLPLEVIQTALAAAAVGDNDIMTYLSEKSRITPGFDPRQQLMSSIQGVSSLFVRNDLERDSDIKFDTRDKDNNSGGFGFDSFADITSSISNMYSPEVIESLNPEIKEFSKEDFRKKSELYASGVKSVAPMGFTRTATPEQESVLTEVGKKLVGKDFDWKNAEHRKAVAEYAKTAGPVAGNQNVSIVDPTVQNMGIAQAITKDRAKFEKETNRLFTGVGTKFIAKGKFYNSRKEMLEGLGLDPSKTLEVHDALGVVDWDNNLWMNLPKGAEQWQKDFSEPVASSLMVDGEAIPIYMSRKDGDLGGNPTVRKARQKLTPIVSKMKMMPGLPEEVEIVDEEGKVEKVKMMWIPTKEGGGVFAYDEGDGNMDYITKQELENNRYLLEQTRK